MAHAGSLEEGERDLAPLRRIGSPIGDGVSPHPYVGWQAAFDPLLGPGARNYWKSRDYVELSDSLIDLMAGAAASLPTDDGEIFTAQLGGAARRVKPEAMAYAHRSMVSHTHMSASGANAATVGNRSHVAEGPRRDIAAKSICSH
jgi:hypothetical protein